MIEAIDLQDRDHNSKSKQDFVNFNFLSLRNYTYSIIFMSQAHFVRNLKYFVIISAPFLTGIVAYLLIQCLFKLVQSSCLFITFVNFALKIVSLVVGNLIHQITFRRYQLFPPFCQHNLKGVQKVSSITGFHDYSNVTGHIGKKTTFFCS